MKTTRNAESKIEGKVNIFANAKIPREEDLFYVEVPFRDDSITFTMRKVPARVKYKNFQECMRLVKDGANIDIQAYYSKMLSAMIVHNTATDSDLTEEEVGDLYDEIFDALIPYVPNPVMEIEKPEFVKELKKK